MLLSTVFVLRPLADGALPLTQGNAIHAWFLHLVQQQAPQLASWLHSQERRKPFDEHRHAQPQEPQADPAGFIFCRSLLEPPTAHGYHTSSKRSGPRAEAERARVEAR